MSESKHTPGPWTVKEEFCTYNEKGQEVVAFDIVAANDKYVIDEEGVAGTSDEARANANLIAAAPDLLESCETTLELVEIGLLPEPAILRRLIAKAKGRES